jgi:hypothetical protein
MLPRAIPLLLRVDSINEAFDRGNPQPSSYPFND